MCGSVFWIIVFFLCLGPCLLSTSKVATQWKNYKGRFKKQTQSSTYFYQLKQKRYSAPPHIIIRPPNWMKGMNKDGCIVSTSKMNETQFYLNFPCDDTLLFCQKNKQMKYKFFECRGIMKLLRHTWISFYYDFSEELRIISCKEIIIV